MIQSINGLLKHLDKSIRLKTEIAVVGMSGGADSTLVATLCARALGPDNVYSVHMPYSNEDTYQHNQRSKIIAEKLGIHVLNVPIGKATDATIEMCEVALNEKLETVNKGNTRSRERMKILYAISHQLSTPALCRGLWLFLLSHGFAL